MTSTSLALESAAIVARWTIKSRVRHYSSPQVSYWPSGHRDGTRRIATALQTWSGRNEVEHSVRIAKRAAVK